MRKFTKYPQGYVKASSDSWGIVDYDDNDEPRMYSKSFGNSRYICIENWGGEGSKNEWRVSVESHDNNNISELPKYFRDLDSAKSYAEEYINNGIESCSDIKASSDVYTWDRNRFDKIVGLILEYWEKHDTCTSKDLYNYLAQNGIDNVDADELDKAWERACDVSGAYVEDDSPVILSNGLEITDKNEAFIWLRENVEEYGNTYFWDSSLKADLNKLIDRFGNTYFWRS